MKKTLLTLVLASISIPSLIALAANTTEEVSVPHAPSLATVSPVREKEENISLRSLAKIKARGTTLIKERIAVLGSHATAINNSKTLTADQKTALDTIISTNTTGLTLLATSIASGTDATSTKVLVQSIYTNFRIYGIVIPQIKLEKRIYDLQNHVIKLSDSFIKIQARIDQYKANGKDVSVWQKSLDDAKILVANDAYKLTNLLAQASELKPADYGTTSKATIEAINQGMKSVVKDFGSVHRTVSKPERLNYMVVTATTTMPVTGSSTGAH